MKWAHLKQIASYPQAYQIKSKSHPVKRLINHAAITKSAHTKWSLPIIQRTHKTELRTHNSQYPIILNSDRVQDANGVR